MPGPCPTTEVLAAALRGSTSCVGDAGLAAHLAECPGCQSRLEEIAGGSGWLQARAKAHAASTKPAPESLHKAMQALESRSPGPEDEAASRARLDFLQPPDQPGVLGRFGSYEVLASVATGGMGIVLRARDPALNRIVALKILPPALAANSLARARFIREARAAAAVVHDHVVPIHAVDECAGLPYLVMQFIKGRSLADRIRATGPLPVEEILRIGAQTAEGLAAAHAQGLIHRDVKPGNILLENSVERVKITDFGLARAADDSSLTQDGHVAGTPEYMSPEQANGGVVDQRADLFGFGCVLYEMATGVSPFRAEKPLAALRRVCEENPPPAHTLNNRIPEWLGLLIQRLMAKDPASRPQTAEEVAAELGRRLAEFQQTSGPDRLADRPRAGGVRGRLAPAWLVVLILPLLLGLVVIIAKRPRSVPEENEIAVTPPGETTPAVGSKPQRAPLFFVSSPGDPAETGFATLPEAVEAAPAGAVIECRFNGVQVIRTLRRVEKAMILRAAPGFEPVLEPMNPGEPIMFTHAALVVEGLTLFNNPGRSEGGGRRGLPGGGGALSVMGAPFLAAHCRFEITQNSDPADRRQPQGVGLVNVPSASLFHCEFACRSGFGLGWNWRESPGAGEGSTELRVQGCTVEGRLLAFSRRRAGAMNLELRQNTFVGDNLLLLLDYAPRLPVEVMASRNVFALETLLRARGTESESTLKAVLRWQGESNVYAVATYLQSSPPMIRHEEWRAGVATGETASVAAELGIRSRLENLTNRTHATEDVAFALTAEERQRLVAQMGSMPASLGADAARNGPGKAYDEWRASPAYQEWLKLVREHLPENSAGR
jgi:serine/threonine-protein kinase